MDSRSPSTANSARIPKERIVTTEVYEVPEAGALPEDDAPLNIVTFTERNGHTTLTLLVQTTTKELRDTILNSGMEVGLQEQLDLLEELAISLR
jgi:hypothetical protein